MDEICTVLAKIIHVVFRKISQEFIREKRRDSILMEVLATYAEWNLLNGQEYCHYLTVKGHQALLVHTGCPKVLFTLPRTSS